MENHQGRVEEAFYQNVFLYVASVIFIHPLYVFVKNLAKK